MKLNALAVTPIFAALVILVALFPENEMRKGYGITETGLWPEYPDGYACSPLTSLYASWIDVDGGKRDEPHSGVDGGRLGEWVLAPASGTVQAVWEANWRWGKEGALLIRHSREDLNLKDGPPYYYSAFDHLKHDEIRNMRAGQKIERGQKLAHVFRPGGNAMFLPEVHWEVWEVDDEAELEWKTNAFGAPDWTNDAARLIDPLYMMSLDTPPRDGNFVQIQPFVPSEDYSKFRGFTYILPCKDE